MRGIVFPGDRTVALHEFDDPTPGPHDVVVEIRASGMCGSDLHYYRAPGTAAAPREFCIGGHEPSGVVAAVGAAVDPAQAAVGDRVMVHHYSGCGNCEYCRSGWTQMCNRVQGAIFGKNRNGAHAPYMLVPAATVMPLDPALSFSAGAAIGCGTGTAWGGLRRLGDVGGSTLVVLGQGPVGLSATMLGAAMGARVVAIDLSADRLQQATELGAAATVDSGSSDAVAAVRDMTRGEGARLVLDTTGSTAAAESALDMLGPWGRVCFVGLGGTVSFDVRSYFQRQITVMTSWSMSFVEQLKCAQFAVDHELPVDALFTHRWRLNQAEEAYQEFDRQSGGKGVFLF